MTALTKEQEEQYLKEKREKELTKDDGKPTFYRIKASFKKDGYKPRVFQCLVCWKSRVGAIAIAEQYFDDFIKDGREDFSYKIINVMKEDFLFVTSNPKRPIKE